MKWFLVFLLLPASLMTAGQNLIPGNNMQTPEKINAVKNDPLLSSLLAANPAFFEKVLSGNGQVQIVYTTVDRKKNRKKPSLTDHFYNVDPSLYFYPASTVKLPIVILALQRLNELKSYGINKNCTMITGTGHSGQTAVKTDSSAPDAKPTIAHYIKKILLVSDNDAFNRLYEFLGPDYINTELKKRGYQAEIIHRVGISMTEDENRHTNPVSFYDKDGKLLYEQNEKVSVMKFPVRSVFLGKGYMSNGVLKNEPFDFSRKNLLTVQDLHTVLKSIIFPELFPREKRFGLTDEDYSFLRLYMSMTPPESSSPKYDTGAYPSHYTKMIYYGAERGEPEKDIRIFNKTGTAYGFLTDAAYFVDYKNNIEFMLTATIYCNSDGIFNDDKYDYETVGYPFLKNLGKVLYQYELTRKRKFVPDLSVLKMNYNY